MEVKGEDPGGYGSAQMNLQMVVGQISSRMDDLSATYAIAFPMTANYLRVLLDVNVAAPQRRQLTPPQAAEGGTKMLN